MLQTKKNVMTTTKKIRAILNIPEGSDVEVHWLPAGPSDGLGKQFGALQINAEHRTIIVEGALMDILRLAAEIETLDAAPE